jgi:hypothetical protein
VSIFDFKTMTHLRSSSLFLAAALLMFNGLSAAPAWSENMLSQVSLTCDKHKITLTTSCREEEADGLPLCPSQKMEAEGPGAKKAIEYKHAINGGDQEFITQAECFKKNDTAYLVLTATNFGNCAGCEWEDVYTPDGTYIGSTSGIYTNAGFRHRSLSQKLRNEIRAATAEKYRTADTGTIPRAHPQR